MKFKIDELPVYFPFEMLYKEQYEYMKEIKKALDMEVPLHLLIYITRLMPS